MTLSIDVFAEKRGTKGSLFKLKQPHAEWITSYINDKPTAVLDQISISLYVIEQKKLAIETWQGDEEMDFQKNCVFKDEAGFNVSITRNRGWSKRGTPAKAIVPSTQSTPITIFGAMSVDGVIDISLRKPTSSVATKKKNVDVERTYDGASFKSSDIYYNILENPETFFTEYTFIIGVSAYTLDPYLITPFPESQCITDSRKRTFNFVHSPTRMVIEKHLVSWLLVGYLPANDSPMEVSGAAIIEHESSQDINGSTRIVNVFSELMTHRTEGVMNFTE
ncbi:hypothetical protein INT47_006473 [Mucor saturninus]|uniref:Uncharacterized protein n=1 Tax=Mucor saturninus TaxID=64648 RepID=A0A8H7QFU6_9FUNG|nr:hypothetical protein INT47_006473 [Mucor saturninus]